jgi:hypothetical protein
VVKLPVDVSVPIPATVVNSLSPFAATNVASPVSTKVFSIRVNPVSSVCVDTLNERFGLNLNERDQLLFDQFEQTWLANQDVVARARNNTFDNFRLVFDREFEKTLIGRCKATRRWCRASSTTKSSATP